MQQYSRLLIALQWVAISGILAALTSVFAPMVVKQVTRTNSQNEYFRLVSSAGVVDTFAALRFVEPGSTAEVYTQILIRLWRAEHAAQGVQISGDIGATNGVSNDAMYIGGSPSLCYADAPSMPLGCWPISGVRFSEDDLIESFNLGDIPMESLVFGGSSVNYEDDRVLEEDQTFSAFYGGTIINPDFDSSTTALSVRPSTDEEGRDLTFKLSPMIQTRTEEPLNGTVVMPRWVGQFTDAPVAVRTLSAGQSWVLPCTARINHEALTMSWQDQQAEWNCSWVSLRAGY